MSNSYNVLRDGLISSKAVYDPSGETAKAIDAWFEQNHGVKAMDIMENMPLLGDFNALGALSLDLGKWKFHSSPTHVALFVRAHELGHLVSEPVGADTKGYAYLAWKTATRVVANRYLQKITKFNPVVGTVAFAAVLAEETRASWYAVKCLSEVLDMNAAHLGAFFLSLALFTYVHAMWRTVKPV